MSKTAKILVTVLVLVLFFAIFSAIVGVVLIPGILHLAFWA